MTQAASPTSGAALGAPADNATNDEALVGEVLRRMDVGRSLAPEELEAHIRGCEILWRRAYERFQQHRIPADRDEALVWLHCMNEAILMRPGMARFLGRQEVR